MSMGHESDSSEDGTLVPANRSKSSGGPKEPKIDDASGMETKNPRAGKRTGGLVAAIVLLLLVVAIGAGLFRRSAVVAVPEATFPDARPALEKLILDERARVLKEPQSANAWGGYGMCLLQHERPVEALICFQQAGRLAPNSARWPYYAGVISEQTNYEQALLYYQRAFERDKTYAPLRLRMARTLSQLGRQSEAIQVLQPLLMSPQLAMLAWPEVLRLARISGDVKLVSDFVKQAQSDGIMCRELLLDQAFLAAKEGKTEQALEARREAQKLPEEIPATEDPWMDEIRRYDASGIVESQTADSMVQQGRYDEAMKVLSGMSERFPERSRPGFNHALVLLSLGQTEAGIRELNQLRQSFPQDPMVHFYLGQALLKKEDLAASETSLLDAVRLKPDFGKALALLGSLYDRQNQSEKAVQYFSEAVIQNPEDTSIRLQLARLLVRLNRRQEARTILEPAINSTRPNDLQQRELTELLQTIPAPTLDP